MQVPFEFVGRKIAIENARLMMEYHLDHLKVSVYNRFADCSLLCMYVYMHAVQYSLREG